MMTLDSIQTEEEMIIGINSKMKRMMIIREIDIMGEGKREVIKISMRISMKMKSSRTRRRVRTKEKLEGKNNKKTNSHNLCHKKNS